MYVALNRTCIWSLRESMGFPNLAENLIRLSFLLPILLGLFLHKPKKKILT